MVTFRRLRGLGTVAAAGMLVLAGGPAMACDHHGHSPHRYVCRGGDFATMDLVPIPSGNYKTITVKGACFVPAGAVIRVAEDVHVLAGAVLDAQSAPSKITVGDDVTAGAGSLLGLGCQPDYVDSQGNPIKTGHPCVVEPDGHSTITVKGDVNAFGANTVLLNGVKVKGSVRLAGGGGAIPWSIKNNTIKGNLKVTDVTADWFGALFNKVGGNVTLTNITATDPEEVAAGGTPTVFIVRNTIKRNLACTGIGPALAFGFYPGEVNTVGGTASGQCASPVST
jgi:hypothetical protein